MRAAGTVPIRRHTIQQESTRRGKDKPNNNKTKSSCLGYLQPYHAMPSSLSPPRIPHSSSPSLSLVSAASWSHLQCLCCAHFTPRQPSIPFLSPRRYLPARFCLPGTQKEDQTNYPSRQKVVPRQCPLQNRGGSTISPARRDLQ